MTLVSKNISVKSVNLFQGGTVSIKNLTVASNHYHHQKGCPKAALFTILNHENFSSRLQDLFFY